MKKIMFYICLFQETDRTKGLRIRTNVSNDPLTHVIFPGNSESLLSLQGKQLMGFKENLLASIRSTLNICFEKNSFQETRFRIVFDEEEAIEGFLFDHNERKPITTDTWILDPRERKMIRMILFEGLR